MVLLRKRLLISMEAPPEQIPYIPKSPPTFDSDQSSLICRSAGLLAEATAISLNRIQLDPLNRKRFVADRFFTGKQIAKSLESKSSPLQLPLAQTLPQLHHILLQALIESHRRPHHQGGTNEI